MTVESDDAADHGARPAAQLGPAARTPYVGRFAPSPTGPLHAGSLVAALASWLDARAHGGRWLVRIEDVDTPRCPAGVAELIVSQLAACGLVADEPPCVQSRRSGLYDAALERLVGAGWAYPCACSRQDIVLATEGGPAPRVRHGEIVYPGTCRGGLRGRTARAMRALVAASTAAPGEHLRIAWLDRRLGPRAQDVTAAIGDFVLKRADGLWAYQLAVVTDDALQGVTHVVRGEDLADNTPRQIHLQRLLGWPTPHYLHTPLVLGADGEKLSKQNGARALDLREPAAALREAAGVLGLRVGAAGVADLLADATAQWRAAWAHPAAPANRRSAAERPARDA